MGWKISSHMLSPSVDNSQWLKKKMKVSKVYTLIRTTMVLSFQLWLGSAQEGPVPLHWGSLNWSLKSLWRKKKKMRNEKNINQCRVHAWHCTRIMMYFQFFNRHNPREGGSSVTCWVSTQNPNYGHQCSRGICKIWGKIIWYSKKIIHVAFVLAGKAEMC